MLRLLVMKVIRRYLFCLFQDRSSVPDLMLIDHANSLFRENSYCYEKYPYDFIDKVSEIDDALSTVLENNKQDIEILRAWFVNHDKEFVPVELSEEFSNIQGAWAEMGEIFIKKMYFEREMLAPGRLTEGLSLRQNIMDSFETLPSIYFGDFLNDFFVGE